jgi:hypothetical protein
MLEGQIPEPLKQKSAGEFGINWGIVSAKASAEVETAPAPRQLPLGARMGTRELAGDPRPLHRRQARQQEADREQHLPRYHQLDATRKLVATVLAQGPGRKYLIQHSAGSGKTNSIA